MQDESSRISLVNFLLLHKLQVINCPMAPECPNVYVMLAM